LYHVITRGNRRQGVFLDEKDFRKFEQKNGTQVLKQLCSGFLFRIKLLKSFPSPVLRTLPKIIFSAFLIECPVGWTGITVGKGLLLELHRVELRELEKGC
jgi:hypothetical protein